MSAIAKADRTDLKVFVENRQTDLEIDQDRCQRLCQVALQELRANSQDSHSSSQIEVNITFLDRSEMAELNREHMGSEGATDVLAFPLLLGETPGEILADKPNEAASVLADDHRHVQQEEQVLLEDILLGDIVVCPSVARDNATGSDQIKTEIDTLIVHGLLHLLGMDHAQPLDAKAMFNRQATLLDAFWKCE